MSRRPVPFPTLRPLAEQFWQVFDGMQNMSDEDLAALEREVAEAKSGNCWCMVFDAANYLRPNIPVEKHRRIRAAMAATNHWQP